MKTAIIGASGYSGGELLRLIYSHPFLTCSAAIAHSQAGELISSVHPHLAGLHPGKFLSFDSHAIADSEMVFFALPHGESGKLIKEHSALFEKKRIVDLGADFRLSSPSQWEKYYGGAHHGTWQYGLPEVPGAREKIRESLRIANPGCYATAITLALAPFALISKEANLKDIVVTAASGTTGAGRNAKVNLIGSEVMNSLSAYKVGGVHQHTPEIEETLQKISGQQVALSFTPFLAPMPRGILASVSIPVESLSTNDLRQMFHAAYQHEEFVTVLPENQWPQTNSLLGSNGIQIQITYDHHVGRAIVIAAIDNLGKGAAGQAIQNANLMMGIPENSGLTSVGVR